MRQKWSYFPELRYSTRLRKFSPKIVMNRRLLERNLRKGCEKAFGVTWEGRGKKRKELLPYPRALPSPRPSGYIRDFKIRRRNGNENVT